MSSARDSATLANYMNEFPLFIMRYPSLRSFGVSQANREKPTESLEYIDLLSASTSLQVCFASLDFPHVFVPRC